LFAQAGSLGEAEQEFLLSSALETNGTTWSSLAAIYHRQGRLIDEVDAWERATALLPYPAPELLALGYAELASHHPEKALRLFDLAVASLPPQQKQGESQRFFASLAHGRAMAVSALGPQH
jgi:tetratricopeptide (TPR) repeat protein